MTKSKKNQVEPLEKTRSKPIYKADELLQKGRFNLTLTEQRIIIYTISKIRKDDKVFQEYTFNLKDFHSVCGIDGKESYNEIKKKLGELRNKQWWILMDDPNEPGTKCESAVNWFTVLRTNKTTGKFTIMFHPDMMPYLLELARKKEDGTGGFFTWYEFRYILPMRSQYSIRLYELLKSYQKNNQEWWFEIEELKRLLDCVYEESKEKGKKGKGYKRYIDFRKYALDKAVEEINKYTDLKISYNPEKDGKSVYKITFFMEEKTIDEKIEAQKKGLTQLDGQIHWWDGGLEEILADRKKIKA